MFILVSHCAVKDVITETIEKLWDLVLVYYDIEYFLHHQNIKIGLNTNYKSDYIID